MSNPKDNKNRSASLRLDPQREEALCAALLQEIEFRDKVRPMTDGELAKELIEKVWSILRLWSWEGVLIDEAITRLKRADTRRRWNERRELRLARFQSALDEGDLE